MTDLLGLTLREASEAVRQRSVSPVALVDAYLARITAIDSQITSYILVMAEEARTAIFAIGSDTGGSVRLPAAACGLQGLKPTFGLVSRYGMLPNCWAFDTVGPLCWNVWDCAAILQAIAGPDPLDPVSAGQADDYMTHLADGVAGMTIGLIADGDCDGVHPDAAILANLVQAAEVFVAAGAVVKTVAMPASFIRYRLAASVINWAESFAIHEADFCERGAMMGQALRDKMMAGLSLPAVDYIAALRDRRVLTEANAALMAEVDLLLLPGAFHVAPPLDDPSKVAAYTADTAMTPFSISGHPAISLCSGFDAEGLPTNIQLVGQWFGEAALLRAAFAYETATPWRTAFPVLKG
ncbi:amidase [Acidisoma cladoniae]|uniref:amidase n=1 Tax=Acidisoma cladoniae TaxID=3040935 RepID=UPI00254B3193|nr:amidase [Acidisoma sp. PAMC 29798]